MTPFKSLKIRLRTKQARSKTYNVELTSTTHNEMVVQANSVKEAREKASILLAEMGWLEWTIGSAWRV